MVAGGKKSNQSKINQISEKTISFFRCHPATGFLYKGILGLHRNPGLVKVSVGYVLAVFLSLSGAERLNFQRFGCK